MYKTRCLVKYLQVFQCVIFLWQLVFEEIFSKVKFSEKFFLCSLKQLKHTCCVNEILYFLILKHIILKQFFLSIISHSLP